MNLLMKKMEPNKKLIFLQTNIITILKFCSPLPLDIAMKGSIITNAEPAHNFAKIHNKDRRWLQTFGSFYCIRRYVFTYLIEFTV
jgi:hypothetical protein